MTEHLKYGIETTQMNNRLYVDVPTQLAARIDKEHPELSAELYDIGTKKNRLVDIELVDDTVRLFINTKKIGAKREEQARRLAAKRVAGVIAGIDMSAETTEKDPDLNVQIGSTYSSDGRLHMRAEVRWPAKSSDERMGEIATYFMRDSAHKLNYERRMINDLVYAGVMREQGLVLETNPLGSCNIGAGGYHYDADETTVELYQHNIYSPIQQLICFTGAVALARADDLQLPVS